MSMIFGIYSVLITGMDIYTILKATLSSKKPVYILINIVRNICLLQTLWRFDLILWDFD